jgi:cytidylate kinase
MKKEERVEHLLKWMESGGYPHSAHAIPFITISRQAGAEGESLGRALAERLSLVDPGDTPWSVWDRELVERIVREEHIPEKALEELEGRKRPSWLVELLSGFASTEDITPQLNMKMYTKIAKVIRAIAIAGRAVLVGRGGFYVTKDLPEGIHVRLVAPLEKRIQRYSQRYNLSLKEAATEVEEIERQRQAFLHRFFPTTPLAPEDFTITLNVSAMSRDQQIGAIVPLVLLREEALAASAAICPPGTGK